MTKKAKIWTFVCLAVHENVLLLCAHVIPFTIKSYPKGFCLINYSTVQIMNILNFGLQFMHYVRSEHRLSDSHIPIQADYGLDGQFVSNWEDIFLHNSTMFLKPQVEFIAPHFLISLFIIQFTANYVVQNLLVFFCVC